MREQVINQKVGNRSGIGSKGRSANTSQRPVRRDRESGLTISARVRNLLGYVPIALKVSLVIVIAILGFLGYRAAAAASFFQVRTVETRGVSRASNDTIRETVRRDVAQTGVWRADLEAISTHLEALPWVRSAIVTRVLPDGIRVRITERQPLAVVRTSAGRLVWVDEDAVVLNEMQTTDEMPAFFLRGWNEEATAAARTENKERVKTFLELQSEWSARSLSERVSEVNLIDTRDVRAQLAGDDSQIEIRLGSKDFGNRLQRALAVLDSERQTARGPYISYIDLSQGKQIVGMTNGHHARDTESEGAAATENTPTNNDRVADKTKEKESKRNVAKKPDQRRT